MIEVDKEERHQLVILFDAPGIRHTVRVGHEDGVDLFKQMQEYYGNIIAGQTDETPTKEGLLSQLKAWLLGRKKP